MSAIKYKKVLVFCCLYLFRQEGEIFVLFALSLPKLNCKGKQSQGFPIKPFNQADFNNFVGKKVEGKRTHEFNLFLSGVEINFCTVLLPLHLHRRMCGLAEYICICTSNQSLVWGILHRVRLQRSVNEIEIAIVLLTK